MSEAHSSYGVQLDEAQKVASSLQLLLKDAERRSDEFRARAHFGEQAASQYKAERDALLTMVSKLHLAPAEVTTSQLSAVPSETLPAPAAAFVVPPQPSVVQPPPSIAADVHAADNTHTSLHQIAARAFQPTAGRDSMSVHASLSHSRDVHHDRHVHHKRSREPLRVEEPPKVQGIAVVPFLARSTESVPVEERKGASEDLHASLETYSDHDSEDERYSGSESEEEEEEESDDEEEESVLHPDSATGSVLDVADRVYADSIGRSRDLVAAPLVSTAPPQFTNQVERPRVSLHGMLAASVDTVTSHGKKKKTTLAAASARSARSQSKDNSITKSKSKGKVSTPMATTLGIKRTESAQKSETPSSVEGRQPVAAVGQPGKSMVIRKPPSYTGATNEVLRGTPSSSPEHLKNQAKAKPTAKVTKGAVAPRAGGQKAVKKQSIGVSSDNINATRQISPIAVANSVDYKVRTIGNRINLFDYLNSSSPMCLNFCFLFFCRISCPRVTPTGTTLTTMKLLTTTTTIPATLASMTFPGKAK